MFVGEVAKLVVVVVRSSGALMLADAVAVEAHNDRRVGWVM